MENRILFIVICAAVVLNACKKSSTDTPTISNATLIVGNWKSTSIAEKDYDGDKVSFYDSIAYPLVQFKTFYKNGTGTSTNDVSTYESFKYAVTDKDLYLTNDLVKDANDSTITYKQDDRTFGIVQINSTTLGLYRDLGLATVNGVQKRITQTTYYTKQ